MENREKELTIAEITLKLLQLLKKYYIVIIVFILLGVISGYFFVGEKEISFKHDRIFNTNEQVSIGLLKSISDPIINFKDNDDPDFLSKQLDVKSGITNNITKIVIDTAIKKDNSYFKLSLDLKDTIGISKISEAIIKYLLKSKCISDIMKKNTEFNKKMLSVVSKKLDELDNIQRNFPSEKQVLITGETYKAYVELFELKQHYTEKLHNDSSFFIVNEATTKIVNTPSRKLSMFKYALAGFITSLILISVIELSKKVKKL